MTRFRWIAAIVAALVLGCGRLDTPDLQHGAVTGQIQNAVAGKAYAYVLGSPDVFAYTAADGSFRLDNVPTGQPQIVLFDGNLGAESLPVQVEGATLSHLDPGRPLNAACAVLAAASPLGGQKTTGLTFTVEGTPLRQVNGESGVNLFPLPAGTFTVRASQPGFRDGTVEVYPIAGQTWPVEMELEVEESEDGRGCVSSGCENGLHCNTADGQCYLCVTSADCGTGGTCTASHTCSYPPGTGTMCEACTDGTGCSSGVCVNPTSGTLTGYCSASCTNSDGCPSGYDCQGNACVVEVSCLQLAATYGATCTQDPSCNAALKDGRCFPFNRANGVAGYCSAKIQSSCPSGFAPDSGSGYCAKQ